jgi:hypothetical protein
LGSVHSMGKQTMHVSLNVFILEWKVALGKQYLVVKVLLAWFDKQKLASWEKLKFLCLCLMFLVHSWHQPILVIRRWDVSRHAGQWLILVKLWNSKYLDYQSMTMFLCSQSPI